MIDDSDEDRNQCTGTSFAESADSTQWGRGLGGGAAAGWVALRLGATQSPRQVYVVGDAIVRLSPRNSATTS
jgi:hypothetical protein